MWLDCIIIVDGPLRHLHQFLIRERVIVDQVLVLYRTVYALCMCILIDNLSHAVADAFLLGELQKHFAIVLPASVRVEDQPCFRLALR